MTTKAVAFSYPSSPNAVRFGHKAGCFTVELSYSGKPPVALCGFATLEEATKHAEGLAFPWSVWTIQNEATLLSTAKDSLTYEKQPHPTHQPETHPLRSGVYKRGTLLPERHRSGSRENS